MIYTVKELSLDGNPQFETAEVVTALETGKIIYLPELFFALKEEEKVLLSPQTLIQGSKNISYDPKNKRLKGVHLQNAQQVPLSQMMSRFFEFAQNLLHTLMLHYQNNLQPGKTSYRPIEIEGRKTSLKKDDTRLHIDAFASMPNQGKRILRVFSNINLEGKARFWHLGEPFQTVLNKFSSHLHKPFPGIRTILAKTGITKSYRTLYDHYMLLLHDNMKLNGTYQSTVPKKEFHFPAGSTWIVLTDSVSHAALSGQYLLEQTFYLPASSMRHPELSPLSMLEKHFGRKLI